MKTITTVQPKAMVLGGTIPHIALIKNLKQRGYYTILVDYYDNPPAKLAADMHIQISTLDKEGVLGAARQLSVQLVISACVDQANVTACYVAEKMGLPAPYSYQTSLDVSDKVVMKKKMMEYGIPTSKHIVVKNQSEPDLANITLPVIVKPSDSNSSKGVKRVDSSKDLPAYLGQALRISRNGAAIVEEYKTGTEVSIYAFIQQENTHVIMMSQRLSVIDGSDEVIRCFATTTPADISYNAKSKIQFIAHRIATAFNLRNTPLHFEVIVSGDDVYVIELTPRVGGGISYKTIQMNTGFDIINATVDSYLGIPAEVIYGDSSKFYAINIMYAKPSVFCHIAGSENLVKQGIIDELFVYKTKGMTINTSLASLSRIGAFITSADSKPEMYKKIEEAYSILQAYDVEGNQILRKDLYLNANNHSSGLQKLKP